MEGYQNES